MPGSIRPTSTSGNAASCTIDGGTGVNWTTASWDATVPAGTTVQLRTRTSADGSSLERLVGAADRPGQAITSPDQRYLQYRVELTTNNVAGVAERAVGRLSAVSRHGVAATFELPAGASDARVRRSR